jgi:hypothetical protein
MRRTSNRLVTKGREAAKYSHVALTEVERIRLYGARSMTSRKQVPTAFTVEFTDPATDQRVTKTGSPADVIRAMGQSLDSTGLELEISYLSLLLQKKKELDAKRELETEMANRVIAESQGEKNYSWPQGHSPLTIESFIELMRQHGQGRFFINDRGLIKTKDNNLSPLMFECIRRGLCQVGDPCYGGGKVRSFAGAIDFVLIPADGYSPEMPRWKVRYDILNAGSCPGHPTVEVADA